MSVKLVTKRKAQKSTGSTTAENGMKSDERDSRGFQKVGAESEKFKERVEVAEENCSAPSL